MNELLPKQLNLPQEDDSTSEETPVGFQYGKKQGSLPFQEPDPQAVTPEQAEEPEEEKWGPGGSPR